VPNKGSVRGFVFDVATGKLREVPNRHRRNATKPSFFERLVKR
jgi:hypothetical protein